GRLVCRRSRRRGWRLSRTRERLIKDRAGMDAQGGYQCRPPRRSRADETHAGPIRRRIRPAGCKRHHARISQRLLVARGGAVEAALQLGHAAMGASAESRPPAYLPAEISHPRIRLPERQRLCEASAAGWNTHVVSRTRRNQAKYFSLSAPSAGEANAAAGLARKAGSSGSGSAGMVAPSEFASTWRNTPRAA